MLGKEKISTKYRSYFKLVVLWFLLTGQDSLILGKKHILVKFTLSGVLLELIKDLLRAMIAISNQVCRLGLVSCF